MTFKKTAKKTTAKRTTPRRVPAAKRTATNDLPTFIEWLISLGACSESIEWLHARPTSSTPEAAVAACEGGDWLLWLAGRVRVDRITLVRCAIACARPALQYVKAGE